MKIPIKNFIFCVSKFLKIINPTKTPNGKKIQKGNISFQTKYFLNKNALVIFDVN